MAYVQINYKSGTQMVVEVEEFTIKTNNLGGKTYEWLGMKPRPLHLNADEIESVWELPSRTKTGSK